MRDWHVGKMFPVVALAAAFLGVRPAWAQFAVSPTIIEEKASPGGLATFTLTIGNTGDLPLACTLAVSAMDVLEGGLPVEVEKAERSCKEWITIEGPEKFTLNPKDGRRVLLRVRTPTDAAGGYYAIISCHGVPVEKAASETPEGRGVHGGIRFSYHVISIFMLTVPAPQLKAVIEAGKPLISIGEGKRGYKLDLPVRNRGNIHAKLSGAVEVRSEAGQAIEKFAIEAGRGFVLPMHERLFMSEGTVNLPDGLYLAHVRLESKDVSQPVQYAFPFHVMDGQPSLSELTPELRAKLQTETAGFAVSPVEKQIMLPAGGRQTQAVEVVNLTKETLHLKARVMEWVRSIDEGNLISEEKPAHGNSGIGVLTVAQETLELRPLARRKVPIVVSLPKGAVGERYAALCFDREDTVLDASPAARARRSVLLTICSQGTGSPKMEVSNFDAIRDAKGVVHLVVRLKNTGDVGISPDAMFYLTDAKNNQVGRATGKRQEAVQAGAEALVAGEWAQVLDPGKYVVELNLRFSPNDPAIVKKAEFVVLAASEATPVKPPDAGAQKVVEPLAPAPVDAKTASVAPEPGRPEEKGN